MLDKKIKGCTSLVLSTLCVETSVASWQTVNAAWYDFLWYLMPEAWWNYLFLKQSEKINQNKKEELGDNEIKKKQIKEKNKNKALELLEKFSKNQGKKFLSYYNLKDGTHVWEFSMEVLLKGENKPSKKKMVRVVLDDSRFTVHKFDLSGSKSTVLYYIDLDKEDASPLLEKQYLQRFLLMCDRIFSYCSQNKIAASVPDIRNQDYDDNFTKNDLCIDFDVEAPNKFIDCLGESIYKIRIGNNGVVKLWTEKLRGGSPAFELYNCFWTKNDHLGQIERIFLTEETQYKEQKNNLLVSSPKDEEIEKLIKDLIDKKCSDVEGCSANAKFIDGIYDALSPNLNKVREKMKKGAGSSLESAVESVYGSEIENVIKKRALINKNRSEALGILERLEEDLSKSRIGKHPVMVYAPCAKDVEKDAFRMFNFSLNLFLDKSKDSVFCKKFSSIIVREDRIEVRCLIDKYDPEALKFLSEKTSDNLVKVDTFEEILLGSEDALKEVQDLADKIVKINALFVNLYKICEKLKVSTRKEALSVVLDFKDNIYDRLYIEDGENGVQRYVSSITVGAKTEEIKVYYRGINEVDTGVLEYNLNKSEDLDALSKIFSEKNIENINFQKSTNEHKNLGELDSENEYE